MKQATLIGIVVGFAGLLLGAHLEGSPLVAFFNVPAGLIVLGGTFGAVLASTDIPRMKRVPALYKRAFSTGPVERNERLDTMVGLAEKARREGLLALEDDLSELDDPFARKGLQLVVDGTDPELVREILEAEIDGMAARHAHGVGPFEKAGGFSPTMGIIGTVMGLVHVLENLDAPETLGPAISGAFIATLYGVGAANVVFLPVANKLKDLSADEAEVREMTLEGILAIQAGDNPRVVAEKLSAYIPPEDRVADEAAAAAARPAPVPDAAEPQPVAA